MRARRGTPTSRGGHRRRLRATAAAIGSVLLVGGTLALGLDVSAAEVVGASEETCSEDILLTDGTDTGGDVRLSVDHDNSIECTDGITVRRPPDSAKISVELTEFDLLPALTDFGDRSALAAHELTVRVVLKKGQDIVVVQGTTTAVLNCFVDVPGYTGVAAGEPALISLAKSPCPGAVNLREVERNNGDGLILQIQVQCKNEGDAGCTSTTNGRPIRDTLAEIPIRVETEEISARSEFTSPADDARTIEEPTVPRRGTVEITVDNPVGTSNAFAVFRSHTVTIWTTNGIVVQENAVTRPAPTALPVCSSASTCTAQIDDITWVSDVTSGRFNVPPGSTIFAIDHRVLHDVRQAGGGARRTARVEARLSIQLRNLTPEAPTVKDTFIEIDGRSALTGHACLTFSLPRRSDRPTLVSTITSMSISLSNGRSATVSIPQSVVDSALGTPGVVRDCDGVTTIKLSDLNGTDTDFSILLDEYVSPVFFQPLAPEPIAVELSLSNRFGAGGTGRSRLETPKPLACGRVAGFRIGTDVVSPGSAVLYTRDDASLRLRLDSPFPDDGGCELVGPDARPPMFRPTSDVADYGVKIRQPSGAVTDLIVCGLTDTAATTPESRYNGPSKRCTANVPGALLEAPGGYEVWVASSFRGVQSARGDMGTPVRFQVLSPSGAGGPVGLTTDAGWPTTSFTWVVPDLNGGSDPIHYDVEIDGVVSSFLADGTAVGSPATHTTAGLAPGGHVVRVRYRTSSGTGQWSAPASFEIAPTAGAFDGVGLLDLRRNVDSPELAQYAAAASNAASMAMLSEVVNDDAQAASLQTALWGNTAPIGVLAGSPVPTIVNDPALRALAEIYLDPTVPHVYTGLNSSVGRILNVTTPNVPSVIGYDNLRYGVVIDDGTTTNFFATDAPQLDAFVSNLPQGEYDVWAALSGSNTETLDREVISQRGGLGGVQRLLVGTPGPPVFLRGFDLVAFQSSAGAWQTLLDHGSAFISVGAGRTSLADLMGVHANGDTRGELTVRLFWDPPGDFGTSSYPRAERRPWKITDLERSNNTVQALTELAGIHRVQVELENRFGKTTSQVYEVRIGFQGYQFIDANRKISGFGTSTPSYGAPLAAAAVSTGKPVAAELTPDGTGTWIGYDDGVIEAVGKAVVFDRNNKPLTARSVRLELSGGETIADIVANPVQNALTDPDNWGYWVVTTRGRVLSFGEAAPFARDLVAILGDDVVLNAPIVGAASITRQNGTNSGAVVPLFLVASDGGVFVLNSGPCSDAGGSLPACPGKFLGSRGGQPLNQPVVDIALNPYGDGYWLFASDGGVFSYGAPFYGSAAVLPLNGPVIGAAAYGNGYAMFAEDGGAFVYAAPGGDHRFLGSLGGQVLSAPITAFAVRYELSDPLEDRLGLMPRSLSASMFATSLLRPE